MTDYIPTTEEVHDAYLRENDLAHPDGLENAHREFVRWLAGVKADARTEFAGELTRLGVYTLSIHDIRKYAKETP